MARDHLSVTERKRIARDMLWRHGKDECMDGNHAVSAIADAMGLDDFDYYDEDTWPKAELDEVLALMERANVTITFPRR